MKNLRIVFMGTPEFSMCVLNKLIEEKYNIVGCVTQTDKPVGRKKIMTMSPVKTLALKNHINVLQPKNIKEEYQMVLDLKPDLIITCAYGQIIPKVILDYPKYECINVHASLLPKYRGGAPIHHAIINGEKQTGITIMKMVSKMDAGDTLISKAIDIDINDTTASLFDKLMVVASELLVDSLPAYLNGSLKPNKQDESLVSYAYNIARSDEYINFNRDVLVVYNHIRGLISWPIGNSLINGLRIKFYDVEYEVDNSSIPLKVYGLKEGKLKIGTIGGFIYINILQVAGKKKQSASEFYNGYKNKLENQMFEEYNHEN